MRETKERMTGEKHPMRGESARVGVKRLMGGVLHAARTRADVMAMRDANRCRDQRRIVCLVLMTHMMF